MRNILYPIIIAFLSLFGSTSTLSAQVVIEDPIVVVETEWANHQIESFHFTTQGVFAFLDDGSIWRVNPEQAGPIAENPDNFIHIPITLMPEAGTDHFPVRIIVHKKWEAWIDFTAAQEAAPVHPERTVISEVFRENEHQPYIKIQKPGKDGILEVALFVNPLDLGTLQGWGVGQRVVVGGVWFPEYDPFGRKDYNCTYLFTVYNYDTEDFVFFAF